MYFMSSLATCVTIRDADPRSLLLSICLAILGWDLCLLPCHCVCAVLMSWKSWRGFACMWLWLSLSVPAERSNRNQLSSVCLACLHRAFFCIVCINRHNDIAPASGLNGYCICCTVCTPTELVMSDRSLLADNIITLHLKHQLGQISFTVLRKVILQFILLKKGITCSRYTLELKAVELRPKVNLCKCVAEHNIITARSLTKTKTSVNVHITLIGTAAVWWYRRLIESKEIIWHTASFGQKRRITVLIWAHSVTPKQHCF